MKKHVLFTFVTILYIGISFVIARYGMAAGNPFDYDIDAIIMTMGATMALGLIPYLGIVGSIYKI